MKTPIRLLFLVFLFACEQPATPPAAPSGKVTAVKDGDTIEVLLNGKSETIRLVDIDSPEKSQAFGMKAKKFTSDLCYGKTVTVEGNKRDQYKRLLAMVFVDGKNINEEIVKAGFAWRYKYSENQAMLELENTARQQKAGLWADDHPVPPWNFRKSKEHAH